jgi:hypothetical protein
MTVSTPNSSMARMPEDRLVRSRQLGYLCGEDQNPSDYCNQRHHEERFGRAGGSSFLHALDAFSQKNKELAS